MKKRYILIIIGIVSLIIVSIVCAFVIFKAKGIITISTKSVWSIGIYSGSSFDNLHPVQEVSNPVLSPSDVTDVKADYVADPFMIKRGGSWYMFFEVVNALSNQGDIGLAMSEDGLHWEYKQIVLDEPFHLSYPYVFKWKNEYYMVPESAEAKSLMLYKAEDFPFEWKMEKVLLEGLYADSSLLFYDDTWWIFTCTEPYTHGTMNLYYSDNLLGPWISHPDNPIIKNDANRARPGGRVIIFGDTIIRFAQDCQPTYGKLLNAYEITKLTRTQYEEREWATNPILQPGRYGWNGHGMHTIDPYKLDSGTWLACVDGYRKYFTIQIEY